MSNIHSAILVFIMAFVTMLIRFAPFVLFKNKVPEIVSYLGRLLPYAVMPMLVVYCLKDVNFFSGSHGLAEIIACVLVVLLHKWKHNTLLSILIGTIVYMVLVQVVFI